MVGCCAQMGSPHLFIVSRAFSRSCLLSSLLPVSVPLSHDNMDAQEVQMLAERYANALEIKKREVTMSQLELQMKLTEMGLVQ